MTDDVLRYTREEAADLIKKDLEAQGKEVARIFVHTGGYLVEIKKGSA